jgi:hypothetical protein
MAQEFDRFYEQVVKVHRVRLPEPFHIEFVYVSYLLAAVRGVLDLIAVGRRRDGAIPGPAYR